MADYIDKRAAIADLNETYDKMSGFHPQFYHGYQVAVNRLRVFQTAEVEPVRHGRWMWDAGDVYSCSCCGEKSHVKEVMEEPDWDWCPSCGARLDGRR